MVNAFDACDLDNNKMCNLDEFLILNRHLHPDLYDEEILVHIFNSYSDIEDD